MNELTKLYAKLNDLKAEIKGFTDDTPLEDIQAKHDEVKKVKAQIDLAGEMEESEKAAAAKAIEDENAKAITNKNESVNNPRASKAYADAFYSAIRGAALSDDQKEALKAAGVKGNIYNAISTSGVPVPKSFQDKLVVALQNANVMRQLATVITTETDKDIPIVASRGTAAWTDEAGAFNESDDTFGVITLEAFKLTRIIKVSEEVLEDVTFDIEGHLVQSFADSFALPEEAAMVNGDGDEKATGVFVSAAVGKTAEAQTVFTADEIIDLYYSLKRVYRKKATWLMNDATVKAIRKLKDIDNNYLWAKGLAGEPDTILGRPVETSDYAPTPAADARIIAFGDFKYYQIADRSARRFQRLNELFSANGQIGFRGYERVDGKLTLAEAVKVLKMAAAE